MNIKTSGWLIALFLFWSISCNWAQRFETLEKRLVEQENAQVRINIEQKVRLEELLNSFSQLICSNREVNEFIHSCTSDMACDQGRVVSTVSAMRKMDHVMIRVGYDPEHNIAIEDEDRRAQIYKLFLRHQIISGITKLLIVAIGPLPKEPKEDSQKALIDRIQLNRKVRLFRNSLYGSDYSLPQTVKALEPQVPLCNARTESLVQIFHRDNPADQLTPNERKIKAPYVDLLIFLVEC